MHSGGYFPVRPTPQGESAGGAFFIGKKVMVKKIKKIEDSVLEFIDHASHLYGEFKEYQYSNQLYRDCIEREISSPIEQLFFVACRAMYEAHGPYINPPNEFNAEGEYVLGCGIFIQQHVKIGGYTVDFVLSQSGIGPTSYLSPVIVEFESYEFYDDDRRQRAYEKSRDRFFTKSGYKILHFTCSEVVADPFKVAHEALCMVGLTTVMSDEYNPVDPLGLGEM